MLEQLLQHFGSQGAIARILDISPSAVNQWFVSGSVPPARAIEIEKLTGGKIRAIDLAGGANDTQDSSR